MSLRRLTTGVAMRRMAFRTSNGVWGVVTRNASSTAQGMNSKDVVHVRDSSSGSSLDVGPERPSIPDNLEYTHIERTNDFVKDARPGGTNIKETWNPQLSSPDPTKYFATLWHITKNLPWMMFWCPYTSKWYFWQDPLTGQWLILRRVWLLFVTIPLTVYVLMWMCDDLRFKYTPWISRIRLGRDKRRQMIRDEINAALAAEAAALQNS
eukprot:TRINITY_DN46038_c0_g1_i1.p3 TRINITY_DN46038_c0_g1~~TRINITY_DN46038_c0_g1_i1.p3  ORF type:complete len:209 (-),score=27.90 TRINITY_DN46038_c0_g1_i1:671-1297(-)